MKRADPRPAARQRHIDPAGFQKGCLILSLQSGPAGGDRLPKQGDDLVRPLTKAPPILRGETPQGLLDSGDGRFATENCCFGPLQPGEVIRCTDQLQSRGQLPFQQGNGLRGIDRRLHCGWLVY